MIPEFRAWIPKTMEGTPMMFYQKEQYLGSFLRRVNMFASNMEHDSYGAGKYNLDLYSTIRDKDGIKIFECDIIEAEDSRFESGVYLYLVTFMDGAFYGIGKDGDKILLDDFTETQIKGNAHENHDMVGVLKGLQLAI